MRVFARGPAPPAMRITLPRVGLRIPPYVFTYLPPYAPINLRPLPPLTFLHTTPTQPANYLSTYPPTYLPSLFTPPTNLLNLTYLAYLPTDLPHVLNHLPTNLPTYLASWECQKFFIGNKQNSINFHYSNHKIMTNPWFDHVKKYAKDNNITYRYALKEAGATYTKMKTTPKVAGRGRGRYIILHSSSFLFFFPSFHFSRHASADVSA